MSWVKVLPENELNQGERRLVNTNEEAILLVNHSGRLCALKNVCPHMQAPLQKGKITSDGAIVCPWHRSAFDLITGKPKAWSPWPPGIGKLLGYISREKALKVYPTRIEEGSIWVEVDQQ